MGRLENTTHSMSIQYVETIIIHKAQQMLVLHDVESTLFKRWSTVYDAGPTLKQHLIQDILSLVVDTLTRNQHAYSPGSG